MQNISSSHIIPLFLLLLFGILLVYGKDVSQNQAIASQSPLFEKQEIRDDYLDWVNMTTKEKAVEGERFTDILTVNYFSDGKTLNSTFWLFFPFNNKTAQTYNEINYGMLIDADFNNDTGVQGIDYQLELGWRNDTKVWQKVLKEISTTVNEKILYSEDNYTIVPQSQRKYVDLSLDLNKIQNPSKYKVIFYAEVVEKGHNGKYGKITDFTKWIAIPPLDLTIETSPPSLEIRKGEEKNVEVKVTSTKGYEPTVYLSTANQTGEIVSFFNRGFEKIRIPSYGIATAPMTIMATKDVSVRPYTLFIFANSSFPSENLIRVKPIESNFSITTNAEKSQNIITQSTMRIDVKEPLSDIDAISEFWTKLGAPITFIYGIIAGLSPWIIAKLKQKLSKLQSKEESAEGRKDST